MDLGEIARVAKDICSIAACGALLCRPLRERIMGTRALREGQRCLNLSNAAAVGVYEVLRQHGFPEQI